MLHFWKLFNSKCSTSHRMEPYTASSKIVKWVHLPYLQPRTNCITEILQHGPHVSLYEKAWGYGVHHPIWNKRRKRLWLTLAKKNLASLLNAIHSLKLSVLSPTFLHAVLLAKHYWKEKRRHEQFTSRNGKQHKSRSLITNIQKECVHLTCLFLND